jgi:hypothetical protein
MSLVTYHLPAGPSKDLDSAIVVNLRPQDALRMVLPDAAEYVARIEKIIPLHFGKEVLAQIVPNELQNLREVVGRERADNLQTRRRRE